MPHGSGYTVYLLMYRAYTGHFFLPKGWLPEFAGFRLSASLWFRKRNRINCGDSSRMSASKPGVVQAKKSSRLDNACDMHPS